MTTKPLSPFAILKNIRLHAATIEQQCSTILSRKNPEQDPLTPRQSQDLLTALRQMQRRSDELSQAAQPLIEHIEEHLFNDNNL